MSTYVVGDIHGHFDEWIELKNKIESKDSNARFILVGDIVDRGPKPIYMLEWCINNITSDGKYQMVIGNHEDEKITWMENYFNAKKKYSGLLEVNLDTVRPDRYNFVDNLKASNIDDKTIRKYLNWMKSLDYYKEIRINNIRFIVVHANLPFMAFKDNTNELIANRELQLVARNYIIWDRDTEGYYNSDNTILVHGHTPTCLKDQLHRGAYPGRIRFTHHRINVDCGLAYRKHLNGVGNLGAIRLDDLSEIYLYNDSININLIDKKSNDDKKEMLELMNKNKRA